MAETAQLIQTAVSAAPKRDKNESGMEPMLLVEDKNELRAMLRKALERAGYNVEDVADGSTAVARIRARRYLLILTDLKLP
jgi:CheY-like chemotaxis protein